MGLDPKIRALFEGPNFAHVASSMSDGSPHVTPVWIGVDGDRVSFCKEESSVAVRNLRRDPRVAISINNVEDPYEEAHVRGTVVQFRGSDAAATWLNDTAILYTGSPFSKPPPDGRLLVVEIQHAGLMQLTGVEHTPPGAPLQLPRRKE